MTALAVKATGPDGAAIEAVLIQGDLAPLTEPQRVSYYNRVCESLGLNPLTQPFEYLRLNGKLKLYARKDATDQLRRLYGVSVVEASDTTVKDVHVVTVKVQDRQGRTDVAKGAVPLGNLTGEALANAIMKAETKAKRRATLSLCGLGMLDEVEVDSIPGATKSDTPEYTPPAAKAKPAPKAQTAAATPTTGSGAPPAAASGSPGPSAAPAQAAPEPLSPPPHEDAVWVELVQRVRELMLKHPGPGVEGLGWHPKHAESWLVKYFGKKRPIDLTKEQCTDACLLIMTRLRTPELYPTRLEQFYSEKRILSGEYDPESPK